MNNIKNIEQQQLKYTIEYACYRVKAQALNLLV